MERDSNVADLMECSVSDQNHDEQSNRVSNAVKNLYKCKDALQQEINISKSMAEGYFQKPNNIFNIEDTLLELAATDVCDGIFHATVIKIDKETYVTRYFQYGNFWGYRKVFVEKACTELSIPKLIPYPVYSNIDVEKEKERHQSQYGTLRNGNLHADYHAFKRKVYVNKNGIDNSLKALVEEMNTPYTTPPVFVICMIKKKDHKCKDQLDKEGRNLNKYYLCTSTNGWESTFLTFRPETLPKPTQTLDSDINQNKVFDLDEQHQLLMTIPNYHKWPFPGSRIDMKYEQKFSVTTRRYPLSPRNKIIHAWFKGLSCQVLYDILYNVYCGPKEIRYPVKKQRKKAMPQGKRKLSEVHGRLDNKSTLYTDSKNDSHSEVVPTCDYDDKFKSWNDVFCEVTGRWKFSPSSVSKKKVDSDPFATKLKKDIWERKNKHDFYPAIPDEQCNCGAGWTSDEFPNGVLQISHQSNLYTENSIVTCDVYKRFCVENTCSQCWDGVENSVFSLSSRTCAGYEIGWEFVDAVMTSGQTFHGFVTFLNNRYRRCNDIEISFMPVCAFIDWFFAWASRMNIEFREGCHLCNGDPKLLACAERKLNAYFPYTFVSHNEAATEGVPESFIQTRRHDRCFLFNPDGNVESKQRFSLHRSSLRTLCEKVLKTQPLKTTDVNHLRSIIPLECQGAFDIMISNEYGEIPKAIAGVFKLLSYDCAVDTLIPFSLCQKVLTLIGTKDVNVLLKLVQEIRFYSYELSNLLAISINSPAIGHVISLIQYCARFVLKCHKNDITPEQPSTIQNTYNPPKYGRAYYFTRHGCQVRSMRQFPIDGTDTNSTFDDAPDTTCEKRISKAFEKGSSDLFLWFCPEHGHCFGFHVIRGSLRLKDPATSLYTHMIKPPDTVLYDYACSLSEYVKNREAGFFQQTKFFHDVFHGYKHNCSPAFRCHKLPESQKVNEPICEQFISFTKRIKTSSTLMSPWHFTFYLQFFIHQWNQSTKEYLRRKSLLATASKI